MKNLFHICLFTVVLRIASCYWIDAYDLQSYPQQDDTDALGAVSAVKRISCMHWGMTCISDSRYKFTRCCGGLTCSCNIWKTHCKCRAKLG